MRFLAVLIWVGALGIAIAESAGTETAVIAVSGAVMAFGGLAAIYDTLVELEEELGVKLAILAVRALIFFGGFGLISELSGGNAYLTAALTVVILTAVFLYGAKDRSLKDFFSFERDEPSALDKAIRELKSGTEKQNSPTATVFDTKDLPVLADLCGHPKAVVTSLVGSGSKVSKGDVVAKYEVISERLRSRLELKEFAKESGTIELLVQIDDEVIDRQPIYRFSPRQKGALQ